MTAATEALRQCIEAMKLVDFKDCGESPELWQKLNAAQANAERVLREGEKQEPEAWMRKWRADGEKPAKVKGKWPAKFKLLPITDTKLFADDVPLYTHPAPSLQAVVEVPKTAMQGVFKGADGLKKLLNASAFWDRQPYNTRFYFGDGIADYLHRDVLRAAVADLEAQAAPQPPAAPSGDVLAAAKSVLAVALEEARGRVHICDSDNNDIKAKTLSEEMQALYAAITATKE